MGPATCQALSVQAAKWDGPARDAYKGIKACLVVLVSSKVPCTVGISYNYMVKGTFDGSKLPWVLPKDVKKLEKLENLGKDVVTALERVLARHELALPKAAAPTVVLAGCLAVRASVPPVGTSVCGVQGG
jgi:hypothetical protein